MAAQRVLEPSPVRLMRVPDAAPPFDGEVRSPAGTALPELEVWTPRTVLPQPVPVSRTRSAEGAASAPAEPPVSGTAPGQRRDESWAGPFACLLAETAAGIRPVRQIAPWLTDRSRVHLRRAALVLRCGQRPRVLRVLVSWPEDDVAELSVIVGLGPRTKALAVRLEQAPVTPQRPVDGVPRPSWRGTYGRPGPAPRWRCTDIETA